MNRIALLPLATLAFVACSENPVATPTDALSVESPLSSAITLLIDASQAPTGTHFQVGTANCSLSGTTVTCDSYELAGVGNSNAQANLAVAFSATVDCRNHGKQVVEVKAQSKNANFASGLLRSKNGRLLVPALSNGTQVPSDADFTAAAVCPNGNWTKEVRAGTKQLSSFAYTLVFVGFAPSHISITGP